MSERICAVVVTHNRIKLLKECIDALRTQTRKLDGIIVVNNDSKDGTKEWLYDQNDLTTIHQENKGGAGGFYTGIKTAHQSGYDKIWCMDDDCLPQKEALENLTALGINETAVLNSTVVDKFNIHKLTFGLYDDLDKKFYKYYADLKGKTIIYNANFFNGTLIQKKVVEKIGYPNKSFFIYGDDYEYFLRIKEKGIKIITVVDSIVMHPKQNHIYVGKGWSFYRINEFNQLGSEYFPRNIMAIWFLYNEYKFTRLLKTYLYDLFGLLFIQKKSKYFFKYIYSILTGPVFINEIMHQKK